MYEKYEHIFRIKGTATVVKKERIKSEYSLYVLLLCNPNELHQPTVHMVINECIGGVGGDDVIQCIDNDMIINCNWYVPEQIICYK